MTHNYLERLFTKKCDKKLITGISDAAAKPHIAERATTLTEAADLPYAESDAKRRDRR